jgi:signal transduction histidine kinase
MKFSDLVSDQQLAVESAAEAAPAAAAPAGHRNLETILTVVRKISTSLILPDVLNEVIDQAIKITHAERGFLMLANDKNELQFEIGRDKTGKPLEAASFEISSTVIEDVFKTGEAISIEDAQHDERFENRMSIKKLELRTITCMPLISPEKIIGVIYVDSRYIQAVNKDEVLYLFEILAGQAAIAIENARLYANLKHTFEELKEANEHIIKSEKMVLRGELVGEVSHELNNLLSVVLIQLQVLQGAIRKKDFDRSDERAQDLVKSIRKIRTFAENLLVRASASNEAKPVDLNVLVAEFTGFIRTLPKYRGGVIETQFDPELPAVQLDEEQIQQVLLNIANNAIEAGPTSTLTFTTRYDFVSNLAKLTIADDGPGVEPAVKEKLFKEKITTKENGHGFGLPICRKIIESHHGTIGIESELGKGTTFTIAFPISE